MGKNETNLFNGNMITSIREALDISFEELAEASGISQNALAAYERGERTPRTEVKVMIAKCFKVKIAEILQ